MLRFVSFKPAILPILVAAAIPFLPSLAGAASACQGKALDACAADASCIWVDGYTRKDGREVASYCRKASARKSAAANSGARPQADKTAQ